MNSILTSLLMLSVGQSKVIDPPLSINNALILAHTDLERLPPDRRLSTRYLWLGNRPLKERAELVRVMHGHCNQLSRESDIVRAPVVEGGLLIRIDLGDYGWTRDLWESLADADPYFHLVTAEWVLWPGGIWSGDGKNYAAGTFRYKKETHAFLVEKGSEHIATQLIEWTQSKCPILRADWFFNQTAIQQDRAIGYYDMLGVKDEAGFQTLIGFDAKKKRRKVEVREAVNKSGVTLQPRAIARETADDGGYWRTFDFRKSVGGVNPLRILGRDVEEAFRSANPNDAATEQYGHLPNGMWATFLGNNKGERQNAAPDFIASDSHSRSNDRRVHINVSCMRCHSNGGLQDIDRWAASLFSPPFVLQGPDSTAIRLLRQQYLREIKPLLERDRATYAAAVKEATGWTTQDYSAAYAKEWERYEDGEVDLAWAARDVGVTANRLKESLETQLKVTGQLDLVLAGLLRGEAISIRQWEESYQLAYLAVKGTK